MDAPRGTNATFDIRHEGETAVITVLGEFDLAEIEPFQQAVRHAFDGVAVSVSLDMSEVSFIDSSGLRAMLQSRAEAEQAGKTLRLVAASPVVARLLELTSLTDAFS